jgi:hypothetical protein
MEIKVQELVNHAILPAQPVLEVTFLSAVLAMKDL